MLRRLFTAVLVPVVAGAVALTAAGADAGEASPAGASTTPAAICAEGELTPHTPRRRTRGHAVIFEIDVSAWVRACPDADPDEVARAKLAWGRYEARSARPTAMEPFPARYERVDLEREMRVIATPIGDVLLGMPRAACMLTGPETRIACFRFGPLDSAGIPEVTPIPTDHPWVQLRMPFGGPVRPPDPACPTCI